MCDCCVKYLKKIARLQMRLEYLKKENTEHQKVLLVVDEEIEKMVETVDMVMSGDF